MHLWGFWCKRWMTLIRRLLNMNSASCLSSSWHSAIWNSVTWLYLLVPFICYCVLLHLLIWLLPYTSYDFRIQLGIVASLWHTQCVTFMCLCSQHTDLYLSGLNLNLKYASFSPMCVFVNRGYLKTCFRRCKFKTCIMHLSIEFTVNLIVLLFLNKYS